MTEALDQGRVEEQRKGVSTRSRGLKPMHELPNPNQKVLKTLEKLGGVSWNPEAQSLANRIKETNKDVVDQPIADQGQAEAQEINIASMAVDALTMIDRFGGDINELVDDLAMKAEEEGPIDYSKIDPCKYKDIFKDPPNFNTAWNHPEAFQRAKWREGIEKEFSKMNQNVVWKKIKQ